MEIEFEQWANMDLRVAEIIDVEDHPNADKLYILRVLIGEEERTIVAGIRKYYSRDELIGKKIIVFANLKPAVLRGVESQGMLLAASDSNKENVVLLTVDSDIESGAKVG